MCAGYESSNQTKKQKKQKKENKVDGQTKRN